MCPSFNPIGVDPHTFNFTVGTAPISVKFDVVNPFKRTLIFSGSVSAPQGRVPHFSSQYERVGWELPPQDVLTEL